MKKVLLYVARLRMLKVNSSGVYPEIKLCSVIKKFSGRIDAVIFSKHKRIIMIMNKRNSNSRRLTVFLLVLFAVVGGAAASVSAQSLALKKAQKEIDESIPTYKKEIVEKCGEFKFDMKVDYDSFAAIPERVGLVQSQGLLQVRNALRALCTNSSDTSKRDEDAARAVREKIKLIVVVNIEDPEKKTVKLSKEGVLTVHSSFSSPSGVLAFQAMRKLIYDLL